MPHTSREKRYFARYRTPFAPLPDLIEPQRLSFQWFLKEGLAELFKEFTPIKDYANKKFELHFTALEVGEPKTTPQVAIDRMVTYEAPIRARVKLVNKTLGTENEQEIFLADIPAMTDRGTFIVNGVERVIVPQLARSFGIFFTVEELKGRRYFGAKIIPARGAWVEFDSEADGNVIVKIDRKRKFPIASLLRVLGAETDEAIKALFDKDDHSQQIAATIIAKDPARTLDESYIEIYRRLRDGDLATGDNAREFVKSLFSGDRYDLSRVGRHRFNERFGLPLTEKSLKERTISLDDVKIMLQYIIKANENPAAEADDIDHLGFRRVRFVGELLQQKMRVGLTRVKRNIQDRMSTVESDTTNPIQFLNPRPMQASIREFFTANQLSQLMEQQNILSEIENLRTLSALGPGGLTRERAGFEVRDVHPSHYGRVCPIHTPEGQNIGLILRLATYARINEFGIIETPYVKVVKGKVTGEIEYLNALDEEKYKIAHGATRLNEKSEIIDEVVEVRHKAAPSTSRKTDVDFIDVATTQMFSIATGMIPFVENDDANRALMGSNMQKQATPVVRPEAPVVATGLEEDAARDTGRLVYAHTAGEVTAVDAAHVVVTDKNGKAASYHLTSFAQTNQFSCFSQRPAVSLGQKVKVGDLLADASSSDRGQMALGQNVRIAFMSWSGANYEDAIIISERLVKQAKFTTIHIEDFEVNVRETKLGPEMTTHDIPNVSEFRLRNLDEEGVVRIGAEVRSGDILVGKVTPKGETQLTPEERLLRSIFGEKAKEVKDTSLRMEGGKRGRVIDIKVFSRERGDNLESGILKRIVVTVAQVRNVSVGDKLAGRHGNKGVISRILPEEDMPFSQDGEPIDIILTPLGVPSRMNLGQILELHLGMAADALGYQAIVPPFAGATEEEIREELVKAGFNKNGKMTLFDGRTGEAFDQDVAVGIMYFLKLHHMVEDKIHMRSIGPYSLITQQPLGGKAQNGGQRFGEMEVWALLGYGAAYTLREMLTIKSDDIVGRSAAFDAIVKGRHINHLTTPASFNVLVSQLRSLGLDVNLNHEAN